MGKANGMRAAQRATFLAELARTANVTAAAMAADVATTAVYRLRAADDGFRARWHAALCEGYARLEAMLLEEALTRASPLTSEALLKARAQKHRLQLSLLAAHRASVRGERPGAALPQHGDRTRAKAALLEKLDIMAARAAASVTAEGGD
jgi:hypothetical protein